MDIKKYAARGFLIFIFYSFAGWLYEIAYETILEHWTFMPREFFRGPICPVYGIGGIILFVIFSGLIQNEKINALAKVVIIFAGTFIVATILEYIASFVLEFATGTWPWKGYANYAYNLGGRISLSTSIKFGVLGVVFVFLLYGKITWFLDLLEKKGLLYRVASVLFILFVFDFVFAVLIPTGVRLDVERSRFACDFIDNYMILC